MHSGTVVLIEDHRDDIDLTIRAFARNRIQNPITAVRDGAEALQLLLPPGGAKPAIEPALILLDLKLPKIDGLEVLRQLRSDPRSVAVPIVVLSSSRTESDVQEAYRLGANSYLVKPVDFEHFTELIGRLGAYWLQVNEPVVPEGRHL